MLQEWPARLNGLDLAELVRRAALPAPAAAAFSGCATASTAAARLLAGGFQAEAARLLAHALPAREAVWWACQCAAYTAPADLPRPQRAARELTEQWVRQQTDALRRAAMEQAQLAGLDSPEAWSAVAAFWSGDSLAPLGQPKVPPAPHLPGIAAAGAVQLSAVRQGAARQAARLDAFLRSAHEIAHGGMGRLEPEP